MAMVSIRDLRNHGGEIVDRAARGEQITITRSGRLVAELRALRPALSAEALLSRWRRLPAADPVALRADLNELVDACVPESSGKAALPAAEASDALPI